MRRGKNLALKALPLPTLILPTLMLAALISVGCQTQPTTTSGRESLTDDATATVNRFQREDPGMKDLLARAHGYAVFPSIGKGGLIVGGAYGKGEVYEKGTMVGYSDLTQATVGAQIGGQEYAELLVFEDQAALDRFRSNQFAFSANASAVAIKEGAAATAKYEDGVAVFTMPKGGLMAEASVGGQKFTYVPKSQAQQSATTRSST